MKKVFDILRCDTDTLIVTKFFTFFLYKKSDYPFILKNSNKTRLHSFYDWYYLECRKLARDFCGWLTAEKLMHSKKQYRGDFKESKLQVARNVRWQSIRQMDQENRGLDNLGTIKSNRAYVF